MKKLSLALLLLVASPLVAQQSQDKTYNFPVSDPTSPVMLEVEVRHGKVVVQGADTDTVSVVARTRPLDDEEMENVKQQKQRRRYNHNWEGQNNKEKEEQEKPARSREGLTPVKNAALNMQIEQRGNRIDIESEKSTYYVELTITVPKSTNVEGSTYRGDGISVSDIDGYLELESWRGDITAERISGPIVAETNHNDIVVSFAQFSEASPSSLTTHSGDIDISVNSMMAANINVQNYQGEVLSGLQVPFEATEKVERKEGEDRQEIVIGGQLTAKLNNGGQDLTLITYSGDVYVRGQ